MIYITKTTVATPYRVTGFSNLTVIFNDFIVYPLVSSKLEVFTLSSKVVNSSWYFTTPMTKIS